MNLSPAQDISLYELALSAQQPPHALQVSPATLKSMVDALIDLLLDQEIPATLLVKLPRGNAWQAELERYRQSGVCQGIYVCNLSGRNAASLADEDNSDNSGEILSHPAELESPPAKQRYSRPTSEFQTHRQSAPIADSETSLIQDKARQSTPAPATSTSFELNVPAESSLRREYFIFVLSEQFCSVIVAHRPRSIRLPVDATETNSERKQPLLAICSTDAPAVEHVLAGLRHIATISPSKTLPTAQPTVGTIPLQQIPTSVSVTTDELLKNWDSLFLRFPSSDLTKTSLFASHAGHLWAKQIQQQEEVWRSITHYRQHAVDAEALQLQNQELLESMHLKDEFLSNVGQALRTPLTNMKTALTLLGSPNLKPAQRDRYMQLLNTECDRQTSLINGLLELVRLDHLVDHAAMQALYLAEMVPGVVSTYQPLAQEKGVMLAYTIPDNLPPVSCLRPWLKQIAINLLHNGIKFTPTGGQVWVQAKQQGDYIQLEFRDTGIGIPASELHKIFERFYRVRQAVDDDPGGAGLGLTIVQQLLLRCGGSISVKSQLGQGSTFNVLLPIYHKE